MVNYWTEGGCCSSKQSEWWPCHINTNGVANEPPKMPNRAGEIVTFGNGDQQKRVPDKYGTYTLCILDKPYLDKGGGPEGFSVTATGCGAALLLLFLLEHAPRGKDLCWASVVSAITGLQQKRMPAPAGRGLTRQAVTRCRAIGNSS